MLDKRINTGDVEAGVQHCYENDAEDDAGHATDAAANQHASDNCRRDGKKLVSLAPLTCATATLDVSMTPPTPAMVPHKRVGENFIEFDENSRDPRGFPAAADRENIEASAGALQDEPRDTTTDIAAMQAALGIAPPGSTSIKRKFVRGNP